VPPDNYLRTTLFQIVEEPKSVLFAEKGVVKPPETPGIGYKIKKKMNSISNNFNSNINYINSMSLKH